MLACLTIKTLIFHGSVSNKHVTFSGRAQSYSESFLCPRIDLGHVVSFGFQVTIQKFKDQDI